MDDADLNDANVGGCLWREPAMDFLSANQAKLEAVPIFEVLTLAAELNRTLVSRDFKTMPRHFAEFLEARGSSPGALLVSQHLPISDAIEELALIWARGT